MRCDGQSDLGLLEAIASSHAAQINEQQRIAHALQSGALTNRQAGSLERGQAQTDRTSANAARSGYIGAREQLRIRRSENAQGDRVFNNKHNARTKVGKR